MNLKRIPTPEEGNENYPLPPDYYELTHEGQREARINACRQWLLPADDYQQKAHDYASSIDFFDRYYLWPDPDHDFNPLFYDMTPSESPEFHYSILNMWANERTTLAVCPRGSAKSMLVAKRITHNLISNPSYSITYSTSTHDNAETMGDRVKLQCYENPRIFDDWAYDSSFDGRIKPRRGTRRAGINNFSLMNGAWLRVISVTTRQRGQRPRRYILDDPEYDPAASTSMDVIRAGMHNLIHKIVLPMVQRPDTGCDWLATFVSKKHYAFHAMNAEGVEDFETWARFFVAAEYEKAGKMVSCWPEMWPLNIVDKKKMAKTDPKAIKLRSLEEIRHEVTNPVYLSEYLGRPGEADESYFGGLNVKHHGYWYEKEDQQFLTDPLKSKAQIVWERAGVVKRMPLDQFLLESRLFMTVDTSFTARRDSDEKACACMALTPDNELFVLDLWSQIAQEHSFIRAIFRMANRWHPPTVHVETIKESYALFNTLDHIVKTKARDMAGDVTYFPAMHKIAGGGTQVPKPAQISTLKTRFDHHLIKLPFYMQSQQPWVKLFTQIEGFNPDVDDGGLRHDDALDVVSKSTFVLKGRKARAPIDPEKPTDPYERLLEGDLKDDHGFPLISQIDWHQIPYDVLMEIIGKAHNKPRETKNGRSRV